MTPRYNKFLDLVALASAAFDEGNAKKAGQLMTAAFKHPHREAAVEAMLDHNQRASTFDSDLDEEFTGEELRIEVEENDDREVQEASARRRSTTAARRRVSASAASRKQNYFDALSK